MNQSPITHVVLVSFHTAVDQKTRNEMLLRLRQLGDDCGGRRSGILRWRAGWNLDQRKNFHIVAVAAFRNEASLQNYREHSKHKEFVAGLSEMADWVVGDL